MPNKYFTHLSAWLFICGCAGPTVAQQTPVPTPASPVSEPTRPVSPPVSPAPTQTAQSQTPPPPPVEGQPPAAPAGQPAPKKQPPAGTPERRLSPPPATPAGGMVSLNFNRADLVEIVHIIAQHLRLTYTIDPEVKGTVTINSAEPLRSEDLLPIFHQILRMNGAVAIKTGNLYRIMLIKDGKGLARPAGQSREDSFALQIVPVRFFSVAEMKRLLTPFLMPGGEIIENPRGNFLIITDLPSNIQRLAEIADLVDVQVFAGTRMEIYQPKVASAEELAQEMTKIMQSYAASAAQPETFTAQFIPLPRINQLLVISHSEAAWTYARRWLDRIDVVAEGPGRRIFIYPVENGKATELADVLSQALGQPITGRRDTPRTLEQLHRSSTSTPGQFGGSRQTIPFGTPGTTFGTPGMPQQIPPYIQATIPVPGQPAAPTAPPAAPGVPTPPGAPRPAAPAPGAPTAPRPEEQLRIVPDPGTNSLIIYGTQQEFQNIRTILKELDIVPRQVLLDVLVAEISLKDSESFGIDYEIMRGFNPSIFGQTFDSQGAVRSLETQRLFPSGGQFGQGISGVIGRGNAVRALINALANDSRAKILSSPSVLATDNRPARIQVGSEEPIATGQVTAATGAITPSSSTTIQYRNTGRIVTIIPQVNSQGLVNLQILVEVSQRGQNVPVGADSFPAFDTRQAETTAVVQDGDTLAIGGIIADNRSRSRTGIPYLMNIPVFGRFFGTTSDTTDRTELIMLITPRVIRSRGEGQIVTEEFKSTLGTIRNELERLRREKEKELEKQKARTEKPAIPTPPAQTPPPPPVSAPADSGPTTAPVSKSSAAPVAALPVETDGVTAPESDTPGDVASVVIPDSLTAHTGETAIPKHKEPATMELPKPLLVSNLTRAAADKPAGPPAKTSRVWVVQVASYDQSRDAESFAQKLRHKGYNNVKVIPAEVTGKTWHRVQVGELATQHEAVELQKTLKAAEKLDQTLVAVR
ncbi:MAG TPA: type II secretion system secretin GspD [Candidatus Binatia bacterium]|nr:type II secretion system secretin GspD [Candidatus Binatia bacterium]